MTDEILKSPVLKRRARWPIPVLLVLSLPVFYYNLGNYGLVNGDEGFYHRVAHNMVRSGDWFTLQNFGELRVYETFMNSPIQHWVRALLITIGGDNYWTMRLLSATCGMLAVIFTYRLARQFMTSAESFLAAVLLMVSYQFVFLHGARTGELDAIITFIFVWLAYSFVRALREKRSFIPHHVGLLVLLTVKLPVIIMPVMVEAIYFAITPKYWRQTKRWVLPLLWMVPIALTWHIYQFLDLGWETSLTVLGLMTEQASGEVVQRFGPQYDSFWASKWGRAGYYGRAMLFGGFPYIIFAPLAAIGVWQHRASGRTTDYLKIIVLVALVVLGFFCMVARRMPWYTTPVYPFAAILVARFLFRLDRLARGSVMTALFGLTCAFALAVSFHPSVVNPFEKRAMVTTPKVHLLEVAQSQWWVYVPVLAVVIYLAVVLLRRVTGHLPVRALPALCILIVVAFGGARIARALKYTTHVSRTERFANDLAGKLERGERIKFPVTVPASRGNWSGTMVYKHFFGEQFEISTAGRKVKLQRLLAPSERPPLPRSQLPPALAPEGSKKAVQGPTKGTKGADRGSRDAEKGTKRRPKTDQRRAGSGEKRKRPG